MLFWRLISSAVIVTLLITAIVFDFQWGKPVDVGWDRPGILTVVITFVLGILASIELDRLTSFPRDWSRRLPVIVAVCLVILASGIPVFYVPYPADCPVGRLGWPVVGALIGLALLLGKEMWLFVGDTDEDHKSPVGPATTRVALGTLAMVYIGFPLAIITQIRLLESNAFGMWALLSIIVIPKLADSGAYFTGHAIGKNKLVPKLSPGKTIEGLCGGLVAGTLGSLLMWYWVGPQFFGFTSQHSWMIAVAYGLVLTVVSVFGDLAESLIKRDCRIKDSSHLVPGLGGILDVIDSILTTAPAAFAFWMVVGT